MKAMLASDFLTTKKYLVQQLLLCLAVGAFIALVMGNLYAVAPAIGVMVPFGVAFTVLALDERERWEQFRLALPLSRTDVIAGRYVYLGALVFLGIAAGLATTGLVAGIAMLMPHVPMLANLLEGLAWQPVVLVSAAGMALMFAALALILPAVARFGMTKAVRYTPLVVFLGVMVFATFAEGLAAPTWLTDFIAWLETPVGTWTVAGTAVGTTFALYIASGALAARLYRSREL